MRALATPRLYDRAKLLGALMRVVYLLTASMPGIIPRLTWRRKEDGTLVLLVPASHADLVGERPIGRMAQLAKTSGLKLELAAEAA